MATASLATVLVAAVLLGLEVWVVGIAVLAWAVSRPTLTATVLGRGGAALAVSAIGYAAVVILAGRLVTP